MDGFSVRGSLVRHAVGVEKKWKRVGVSFDGDGLEGRYLLVDTVG